MKTISLHPSLSSHVIQNVHYFRILIDLLQFGWFLLSYDQLIYNTITSSDLCNQFLLLLYVFSIKDCNVFGSLLMLNYLLSWDICSIFPLQKIMHPLRIERQSYMLSAHCTLMVHHLAFPPEQGYIHIEILCNIKVLVHATWLVVTDMLKEYLYGMGFLFLIYLFKYLSFYKCIYFFHHFHVLQAS